MITIGYRMKYNQYLALCLVALVFGQVFSLPQHPEYSEQYPGTITDARKFAEKPNSMKKVGLDNIEEINTNQIQVWSLNFLNNKPLKFKPLNIQITFGWIRFCNFRGFVRLITFFLIVQLLKL